MFGRRSASSSVGQRVQALRHAVQLRAQGRRFNVPEEIISVPGDPQKIWAAALRRAGHKFLQEPKRLGAGSFGQVFLLDNGLVLKVTTDQSEAQASENLRRLGYDACVVRIFDVFAMAKPGEFSGDPQVFGIVQEYLRYFEPNWYKFTSTLVRRIKIGVLTEEEVNDRYKQHKVRPNLGGGAFLTLNIVRDIAINADPKPTKIQLDWLMCLLDTFGQAKIKAGDLHYGNIMQRLDGTPVLIDVGMSRTRQRKIPELVL